ncbi:hypothetical protein TraAM80_02744 [Trypanosoma rangeli]|uniref:Uncharacterized protein n=1 Tax=Trypanosoma rangeli TaxID=5698 RepID=A0A3R7NVM0_TRYRA|nr:uncharacterized protein TraAM80_02744 [Trypanosoma rangeli]RNF08442.1 hypothetical protein TraAM80_02744 [Trypanosoma rangeli]|eukprot:RNF08442.1 hypothetical protein TraAM80_02744 [Trypanosoma rangeli]
MAPKRKSAAAAAAKEAEAEECTTEEITTTTPPMSPSCEASRSGGNAAELYATLQAAVAEDHTKVNDFVRELLQALNDAESQEASLLVRVRTLEFISHYGQYLRDGNALKKVVTSLVKILSGPEDTPQLLMAAVQGLSSLGPVSVLDKKWEYLSREGADVLMQVMLDEEGFAEGVRQAASKALDSLIQTAFRPVVTKLLHWISDNRETEDEEQLKKERRMAMTRLRRLAHASTLRSQWTEEVQEHVLSLIVRVLSTVTVQEFVQLTSIAAALPMVRAEAGVPLLKAFLAQNTLNTDRALESLSIIGQCVGATPYDLVPVLEDAGLLTTPVEVNTTRGIWHAEVLLLGARLATPDNIDKVYNAALRQLDHVMQDGAALPENMTILEVLLFAVMAVGQKKPVEMLKHLNDDAFAAKCKGLTELVSRMEPLLVYAVKKRMQRSVAGQKEAEVLGCCHNVRTILSAFSSKHMPMGTFTESWLHKNKLPALKRRRETEATVKTTSATAGASAGQLGVLPPLPGTDEHARKRPRGQGHGYNKDGARNRGVKNANGRFQQPRRGGF